MPPKRSRIALADRLQGLEAGPALGGMKTDALGRAVVNGHEDKGWPLGDGHRGRHVRTPHYVGRLSGDGPVVRLRPVRVTRALRGLEVVLPHQPPHPLLRGAPPLNPQLRPHFSVALAMKRRGFEHPTNVGHQDVIRGGAARTAATTRRRGRGRLTPRIHAGAGAVPHAADPLHAIRPTGGDRLGATHRVDLRRAQRAAGLQLVHLRIQQLGLHQQLADLGLQPTMVVVPGIRRAAL